MPRVAPTMPRKMLPPPTTIAISTPSSTRASATSSAIRWTTAASMPNEMLVSAKASPESFSTTRRNRLSVIGTPGFASGPTLFLAHLDAGEPADLGLWSELLDELAHGELRVPHEALLEEDVVLVEAVQPALHDLADRGFGLALVARQLGEHLALLLDRVGRDVFTADVARRRATSAVKTSR